jgi:hypothetical protein
MGRLLTLIVAPQASATQHCSQSRGPWRTPFRPPQCGRRHPSVGQTPVSGPTGRRPARQGCAMSRPFRHQKGGHARPAVCHRACRHLQLPADHRGPGGQRHGSCAAIGQAEFESPHVAAMVGEERVAISTTATHSHGNQWGASAPYSAQQGPGRKEARGGSHQLIYQPPLTLMVWPVM